MKYKVIIIILSLLSTYLNVPAHNNNLEDPSPKGYKIKVNAPFAQGSMAYLAKYWKGAPYTVDSVRVSPNGLFAFSKSEELSAGQYLLYIKPDTQIELLIDQGQNNIAIELDEDLPKSTIKGSDDTQLFWDYIRQYQPLASQLEQFSATINDLQSDEIAKFTAKRKHAETIKEIDLLFEKQMRDNQGTWFASFIKASQNINLPYPFPENNQQYEENRQYLTLHFFDRVDFLDTRLWSTEFFTKRLDSYLFDLIPQHPDSIARAAADLVAKTDENDRAFELMLSHLYNEASTSNAMGMENVWAKLAEDYIFDKNISWIDSTLYNNMKAQYSIIELNRLGMKAQDMKLMTIDGDSVHTNYIETNYTLLYFYSPTCSHCEHDMPILRDFYTKYKEKGLKVVAINVSKDIDEWKKFMQKHGMETEGWFNLFDPDFKSQYWLKYDANGTPSLYFLDKNKIILARKIDIPSLERYLERILN